MQFSMKPMVTMAMVPGAAVAATACGERPEGVAQRPVPASPGIASNANDAAARAADTMDDAAIATKVKAAILAEPGLNSLEIGVTTKGAVVALTGKVASPQLKERATQVAAAVSGVRSVVDQLQTEPTG